MFHVSFQEKHLAQKHGVAKLLDTSCGESYDKQMEEYIAAQDGVLHVDSLRSRMFGNKVYIDLAIQVDGETCGIPTRWPNMFTMKWIMLSRM